MGIDRRRRGILVFTALLLTTACSSTAPPTTKTSEGRIPAPATVSAPWRALLRKVRRFIDESLGGIS